MTGKTIEVNGPEKPEKQTEDQNVAPEEKKPDDGAVPPAAANDDAATEREKQELTDHLQRLAAEFENFKKRTAREMGQAQEIGKARVLEAVLPVLDSFERSLIPAAEGQDAGAWREGFVKIRQQLIEALEKQGLAQVPAGPGEPLNPNFHEVMMTQQHAEIPADHILQIY